MKSILIQQVYPDLGFEKMLELTQEHHKDYCERFGIVYQSIVGNPGDIPPEDGSWGKIELIRQAIADGYEQIVWLDADALIIDMDTNIMEGVQPDKIGVCWHRIPQGAHWNIGVLYIGASDTVSNFIIDWLASYPPPKDGWMEQGVFNRMAHEGKTVVTISDKWNATLNVNMVPDAVVLGFHGQGDTEQRYELMKQTMARLFPEKKAEQAQGEREVKHG
jgi:hypothetical protein